MVLFVYKFQPECILHNYYHKMTAMVPNRIFPMHNNHPEIVQLMSDLVGKMELYYKQLQLYLSDKYLLNLDFHLHQILHLLLHPRFFQRVEYQQSHDHC